MKPFFKWVLRLAMLAQLVLGFGRFFGMVPDPRIWETHISLGVLIAVLALIMLRPLPSVPASGMRQAAQWLPLLVLIIGVLMWAGVLGGRSIVMLHMTLGILSFGLIEASMARERKALRAG